MRKPTQTYDLELPFDADYKTEFLHNRDKQNYESDVNWIYIGADRGNPNFAKIGLTRGNLGSRSAGTNNPKFYIFCAFKCKHDISPSQLKLIEKSALYYLDSIFSNPDGTTKREVHTDSGMLSECYYNVDFDDFFWHLHYHLYQKFNSCFINVGFEQDGADLGTFLDCTFNARVILSNKNHYLKMILQ